MTPWDITTTSGYEDTSVSGVSAHHQHRLSHQHTWHPMGSVPCLVYPPFAPQMWQPLEADAILWLDITCHGDMQPLPCLGAQPSQELWQGDTGIAIEVVMGEIPAVFTAQQGSPHSPGKATGCGEEPGLGWGPSLARDRGATQAGSEGPCAGELPEES